MIFSFAEPINNHFVLHPLGKHLKLSKFTLPGYPFIEPVLRGIDLSSTAQIRLQKETSDLDC